MKTTLVLRTLCITAIITMMGATTVMAVQKQTAADVNNPDYYGLVKN